MAKDRTRGWVIACQQVRWRRRRPVRCRRRRRGVCLAVGMVGLVTAACGGQAGHGAVRPGPAPTSPAPTSPAPTIAAPTGPAPTAGVPHVMVVVLENREQGAVIGDPHAPYLNGLARRFGVAQNAYGTTHPSLPNYLELLAGTTFGIDSDCGDCRVEGPTLVDQLDARGVGWEADMEAKPAPRHPGGSPRTHAQEP